MLHKKAKKFKAISEKDAFEFEVKINAALDALIAKGIVPDIEFNHNMGHCAYLMWTEETQIPENAKDEYELLGERHKCIECPYYIRPTDGRIKYTRCPVIDFKVGADNSCCEQFYEELERGIIQLVEIGKEITE